MELVQKFGLPAVLAYAGARAATLLGSTSALVQLAGGIGGAFLGLVLAEKLALK